MAERYRYLSFGRVLQELQLSRDELLKLVHQGYLRAFQDHKRLVFRKEDVERLRESWSQNAVVLPGAEAGDAPPSLETLGLQTDNDPASEWLRSLPESMLRPKLGQILKEANQCSEGDLQDALALQAERRKSHLTPDRLGEILVELRVITPDALLTALASQAHLKTVDLSRMAIETNVLALVPKDVATMYDVLPVQLEPDSTGEGRLVIATHEPQNRRLADDLTLILGRPVRLVVAPQAQIQSQRHALYARVVPRSLMPVRTSSGRLRLAGTGKTGYIARFASEALRRWYAEPPLDGKANEPLGPRVFLAMPFTRLFDPVAEIICTTVEALHGRPLRIDQVPNLKNIWLAIEREIARADMVIADFSGDVLTKIPNPNVVTEAAIAFHKYEKPVVVLTQSTEGLFFDWRHQFAVVYSPDEGGLEKLHKLLANRLAAEFSELANAKGAAPRPPVESARAAEGASANLLQGEPQRD